MDLLRRHASTGLVFAALLGAEAGASSVDLRLNLEPPALGPIDPLKVEIPSLLGIQSASPDLHTPVSPIPLAQNAVFPLPREQGGTIENAAALNRLFEGRETRLGAVDTNPPELRSTPYQPLDPRMALSIPQRSPDEFWDQFGPAVRAIPGVARIDTAKLGTATHSLEQGIAIQISPSADLSEIKAALERYRYAGLEIHVLCGRWLLYGISKTGNSTDYRPLDPRMALSIPQRSPDDFWDQFGPAVRAIPGVGRIDTAKLRTATHSLEKGIAIQVSPSADLSEIKAALERYRYAGLEIHVLAGRWLLYSISKTGKSTEH